MQCAKMFSTRDSFFFFFWEKLSNWESGKLDYISCSASDSLCKCV